MLTKRFAEQAQDDHQPDAVQVCEAGSGKDRLQRFKVPPLHLVVTRFPARYSTASHSAPLAAIVRRREPSRLECSACPIPSACVAHLPADMGGRSPIWCDTGAVDQPAVAVDHVLLAVDDLEHAAAVLNDRYGLASVAGGQHPWGTANRIVPVGDAYLELIAVVDANRARETSFGRLVSSAQPGIIRPLGWAVRIEGIEDVARRLGLAIEAGSRATPDGQQLHWKLAGVERAAADPALPFFIEWGAGTPHPSRLPVSHDAGSAELSRVDVRGDSARLHAWLGDHDLPVRVESGPSAVTRVVLTAAGREIVLESIAT